MHTFCLQERLVLKGQSNTAISQGENGWLDLGGHQHVVAWLVLSEVTTQAGTLSMSYQTAPRKDDSLFVAMSGPNTTMPFAVLTPGVTVTPLVKDFMNVPVARWVRWQVVPSGTTSAWSIDFEIYIAASGMLRSRGHRMHVGA